MKEKTREVAVQNGNENIYHYRVVIYRDEDDVFIAECPALEGCMTDGATFEEAAENIKDAVACHVSALKKLGRPIPVERDIYEGSVRVAV
jgi:predicted RNase H-like HicB family nuclease